MIYFVKKRTKVLKIFEFCKCFLAKCFLSANFHLASFFYFPHSHRTITAQFGAVIAPREKKFYAFFIISYVVGMIFVCVLMIE